ncbi:MAG: hypothetical protein ACXW3M_15205 [Rhodoplanes sp.]
MTDSERIAKRAALDLSAAMDPSLSSRVDRVLSAATAADPKDPLDGGDLASFLVAAAGIACRIHTDLKRRTDSPSWSYMERRLRSEMGIDEGVSPDHDNIVDALVAALLHSPPA